MSKITYSNKWCYICGKNISASGGGVHHFRKHVREGKMVEITGRYYDGTAWIKFDPTPGVELIIEPRRRKDDDGK